MALTACPVVTFWLPCFEKIWSIEDTYKTKIELASSIITELINLGFEIELVLADSLYGEASSFIKH
jgi:SRSO17 transposase